MSDPMITSDRATWHVGQRVSRKDTSEHGTVVEVNGRIKVKWDHGATSIFKNGASGNVKLLVPAGGAHAVR